MDLFVWISRHVFSFGLFVWITRFDAHAYDPVFSVLIYIIGWYKNVSFVLIY